MFSVWVAAWMPLKDTCELKNVWIPWSSDPGVSYGSCAILDWSCSILSEMLTNAVLPLCVWKCFCSHKRQVHSRAYINFKKPEDVIDFYEVFNGHIFVNEKGAFSGSSFQCLCSGPAVRSIRWTFSTQKCIQFAYKTGSSKAWLRRPFFVSRGSVQGTGGVCSPSAGAKASVEEGCQGGYYHKRQVPNGALVCVSWHVGLQPHF